MSAPIFASLFFSDSGPERWAWAAGLVMSLTTVTVSTSRSAWLGATVGLLVLVFRLPRRFSLPLVGVVLTGIVITGSLLATGWMQERFGGGTGSLLVDRFISSSLSKERERPLLWRAALRGVADAPLLGNGFADEAYDTYRDAQMKLEGVEKMTFNNLRPHNQYLRVAFALGIPGLMVFLWLWGAVFAWSGLWIRRSCGVYAFRSGLLWGICGAMAGVMVSGFFLGQFFDAEVQVNILMWMGLAFHIGLSIRRDLEGPLIAG